MMSAILCSAIAAEEVSGCVMVKKQPPRRMLAPIWLDKDDMRAVDDLQESLWARTRQDAFLQCLRWGCRRIEAAPTSHRKFLRESNRPYADGEQMILRVTEEQRAHLDEFQERTHASSMTEAVRILVRMAHAYFCE